MGTLVVANQLSELLEIDLATYARQTLTTDISQTDGKTDLIGTVSENLSTRPNSPAVLAYNSDCCNETLSGCYFIRAVSVRSCDVHNTSLAEHVKNNSSFDQLSLEVTVCRIRVTYRSRPPERWR